MNILPEAIRKAQEGEKILLIYPTDSALDTDFRSNPGFDVNMMAKCWKFTSGGVIAFRTINLSPEVLKGLSVDIWFARGAERIASQELWEEAKIVAGKYKNDPRRQN